MATSLVFDRTIEGKITDLSSDAPGNGLLIGHRSGSTIYVVHLARTLPMAKEDETPETTVDGPSPPSRSGKTKSLPESSVDERSILQHVRQTIRMLPGGLDIIGIFFVSSAAVKERSENVAAFQKVLRSAYKTCTKVDNIFGDGNSIASDGQMILLSVEPPSKNKKLISATLLDCRPSTQSSAPSTSIPVSYQNLRWRHLSTRLVFDVPLFVSTKQSRDTFLKQFTDAVRPWCNRMWTATASINGDFRDDVEPIVNSSSKSEKGKSREGKERERIEMDAVDLFLVDLEDEISECNSEPGAVSMHIRGTMYCLAIVNQKATVGEAVRALKVDALRSLFGRCESHYEGMAVLEGEELDPTAVHQFPRRVFAPITKSGIVASDYLFEGDVKEDAVASFKDVLDLDVTPDAVEDTVELVPSQSALQKLLRTSSLSSTPEGSADAMDRLLSQGANGEGQKRGSKNVHFSIYAILTVLVVLLAYLAYFVFGMK